MLFYRRMEKFFTRRGYPRYASQTQQEYAADLSLWLTEQSLEAELVKVPVQVAKLFYSVRFGDREVTDEQLQVIEHGLQRLSSQVGKHASKHRKTTVQP